MEQYFMLFLLPFVYGGSYFNKYNPGLYKCKDIEYTCKDVDGRWGEWSCWSKCSVTCGDGGKEVRTRHCNNPQPKYNGKPCVGHNHEWRDCACALLKCPEKDGEWDEWEVFGQCSKSCGIGEMKMTRECKAKHCGKCIGPKVKYVPCGKLDVDGGWTDFVQVGKCSKSCGIGVQKFHRYCTQPSPQGCGKPCVGKDVKYEKCGKPYVDGKWSEYVQIGECSKTCGVGTLKFKRYCALPRGACSKPCVGKDMKYEKCGKPEVDGEYGGWMKGKCIKDKKCKRAYHRYCNSPSPSSCGKPCQGYDQKDVYDTDCCEDIPPKEGPCGKCIENAKKTGHVGFACRVDQKHCDGKKDGIKDMYPAAKWFFLHCSLDGPWCKPCAVKTLVYNPTCGQCEATKNGMCTGPQKWRNKEKKPEIVIDDIIDDVKCEYPNVDGGWGDWIKGKCFKNCKRGLRRYCNSPLPSSCGKPCKGYDVKFEYDKECCKEQPPKGPCGECLEKAKPTGHVGFACQVDHKHCNGKKGGINDMYPAANWFFLHCSSDGPWCKPCAVKTLVYNPMCGQCEATRNGMCTGPQKWRNKEKNSKIILNDEDLW